MEIIMRLSAPKNISWFVAVILGVIALIGELGSGAIFGIEAFWFAFVGLVLLVLATFLKGL